MPYIQCKKSGLLWCAVHIDDHSRVVTVGVALTERAARRRVLKMLAVRDG